MSEELAELRFRKGQARVIANVRRRLPTDRRMEKTRLFMEMAEKAAREGFVLEIAGVPAQASLKRARELAQTCREYGIAQPAVIVPGCLVGLDP